jgi:hypothetical protein
MHPFPTEDSSDAADDDIDAEGEEEILELHESMEEHEDLDSQINGSPILLLSRRHSLSRSAKICRET